MKLNRERLIEEIEKNNLNQRKLADKIDVSEVSMSRYVNGDRMPRGNILLKMAKALQTTPEYLAGIEDEKDHLYALYQVRTIINVHGKHWDNDMKIALIQKLLENIKKFD